MINRGSSSCLENRPWAWFPLKKSQFILWKWVIEMGENKLWRTPFMVDPEKKWVQQQHRIENVLGKGWMSFVSRVLNTSLCKCYKMLKVV